MKVLYYTSPFFLDTAIEVINILKNHVDLHVLIEITPQSKVSNILEVDNLFSKHSIIGISELLKNQNQKSFKSYFDGCKSANFIIHTHKSGFSFSTVMVSYKVWKYIKKIQPDIIHLEAMSLRSLGIVPFLFSRKKFFLTIHDGIPHIGERDWKNSLPRFLYLKIPYLKSYFFYSKFTRTQFEQYYKKDKYPKFVLTMHPCTFFKTYLKNNIPKRKNILFFGRLSSYKGIDVLLKAIPLVLNEFNTELFVIAGQSTSSYNLDLTVLKKYESHILLLNRHIPNEELVALIQSAKFIVCPYLEATQSGVLMASYALNTPVIATNTGAFQEYIDHNITGILVPVNNPAKLAEAIKLALRNKFYLTMEESIANKNITNIWERNTDVFLKAYLY